MNNDARRFRAARVFTAILCLFVWMETGVSSVQAEVATAEGTVQGISMKAGTIQLRTAEAVHIVRFDESTKLVNLKKTKQIREGDVITIAYEKRANTLFATEIKAKPVITLERGMEIKASDLRALLQGEQSVSFSLIDARPPARYDEAHLPGSISMFAETFDEHTSLLPGDRERLLVFYCGGPRCGLSRRAAEKARDLGYTNIRVYKMGEPDWRKRKLPLYSTPRYVENTLKAGTGIVLVDTRSDGDIREGHIPGAVSLALDRLDEAEDEFPSYLQAPILVYGTGEDTAVPDAVALQIKEWGYREVTVLAGGFSAWKKAGSPVATGPVSDKISYVRRLGPGEIAHDEFTRLAVAKPDHVVLVDCREPEEFAEGHVPGAVNIPTDDVSTRMGELPRDSKIVTYCNTGVRAEMAYHVLKDAGYATAFLNAEISIDPDGSFEIEE